MAQASCITKFTLEGADMPAFEWLWSDNVEGAVAQGPYYSSDAAEADDQVWGIVLVRDANNFAAGWSCGERNVSAMSDRVFPTAMQAADEAERMAATTAALMRAEAGK